jgi:hypothetical protein
MEINGNLHSISGPQARWLAEELRHLDPADLFGPAHNAALILERALDEDEEAFEENARSMPEENLAIIEATDPHRLLRAPAPRVDLSALREALAGDPRTRRAARGMS